MAKNNLKLERKLKFGIELEVVTNLYKGDLIEVLVGAGVKVETRMAIGTHEVCKGKWKVVKDTSISNGWEIVSPPLSSLKDVEKVCKGLAGAGVTVDKTCGFHVHHDIADLQLTDIKNVYKIYDKYEEGVIEQFLPVSRRGSRWCKPVSEIMDSVNSCESIEQMANHSDLGGGRHVSHYMACRYRSINFRAYVTYGTIEFRHHSGTIDFEKIKNWVLLTHTIIDTACKKSNIKPVSEARARKWQEDVKESSWDFYKELGINGTELSEYLGKRRKLLKRA